MCVSSHVGDVIIVAARPRGPVSHVLDHTLCAFAVARYPLRIFQANG